MVVGVHIMYYIGELLTIFIHPTISLRVQYWRASSTIFMLRDIGGLLSQQGCRHSRLFENMVGSLLWSGWVGSLVCFENKVGSLVCSGWVSRLIWSQLCFDNVVLGLY